MKNYKFEIVEGHIVRITHYDKKNNEQIWNIYLENIFWGGRIKFPMYVEKSAIDSILWMYDLTDMEFQQTGEYRAKGPNTGVICVYTNKNRNEMYFIMYTNRQQMYKKFIHYSHRKEGISLKNGIFELKFDGCVFSDKWKFFELQRVDLVIDQNHRYQLEQKLQKGKQYSRVQKQIPLESIVSQETEINNPIHVEVWINDEMLSFNIGHKTKKKQPKKFYYIPIISCYYKDKALFVRGNVNQNYTLVVRGKEPIEYDKEFLQLEEIRNSRRMYYKGKLKRKFQRKKVNLYYEKNSFKAEEGTFEIFEQAVKENTSENYFILDDRSPQWDELSKYENVIRKYSKEYYELLYRADCFISTETPSHLNVHRAVNKYVRKTLLEKKFVFLQHGITYLKCQGAGSVFGKDKEGEPDYIMVGSDKEAEVVAKMLHIPKKRCIKTGLPIFSTIEHEHINEKSDDVVTIMFTWKPSEEHMLSHFEDSTYYRKVQETYKIVSRYYPPSRINIVPHPKVYELLMATDMADMVWDKPVSEALAITKVMITDYSSACYNAFYQGAAVIFYQPDLEDFEHEVGKLVPKDDEYVGYRCFDLNTVEQAVQKDYKELRSEEFVDRYLTINEFTDGKNVERTCEFLRQKKIV